MIFYLLPRSMNRSHLKHLKRKLKPSIDGKFIDRNTGIHYEFKGELSRQCERYFIQECCALTTKSF